MKKFYIFLVAALICSLSFGQRNNDPKNFNYKIQLTSTEKTQPNVSKANPTVVLNVIGDPWSDGSGFQLLLSSNNNGTAILTALQNNAITCGYNYNTLFNYFIPTNADASDANVVLNSSQQITVPAGNYIYYVTNPSCAAAGEIYDVIDATNTQYAFFNQIQFLADYTYTFTIDFDASIGTSGFATGAISSQYTGTATPNATDIAAFFATSDTDPTPITGTVNINPTDSFTFFPTVANIGTNDINFPITTAITMNGTSPLNIPTITTLVAGNATSWIYPQGATAGITFTVAELNQIFGTATSGQVCITATYDGETNPANNNSCFTLDRSGGSPTTSSDLAAMFITSGTDQTPVTEVTLTSASQDLVLYPIIVNLGPDASPTTGVTCTLDFSGYPYINNQAIPQSIPAGSGMMLESAQGLGSFTIPAAMINTGQVPVQFQVCLTVNYAGDPITTNNNACVTVNKYQVGILDNATTTFSIYPNPSNGSVNIISVENTDVNVYDVAGKLVKTLKVNAGERNSVELSQGMYFVKVNDKVEKIIVE